LGRKIRTMNYNFPDHIKGDTFNGLSFTIKNKDDDSPIDLTGVTIRMMLRDHNRDLKKTFSTGSGMTISNPAGGVFQIDEQVIDIYAGKYNYDIEFTFPLGKIKTYISGKWEIIQDVTYG